MSVDFSPDGDGTRVDLVQTGFPDAEAEREHGKGWPVALRIMEDALLAASGIGSVAPSLPKRPASGVVADLEEARRRWENERDGKPPGERS